MVNTDHLFSPLPLRGVVLRNRIAVSPMCQYSSQDGFASDWHLVHLGSRAVGGAGLVMTEATAVEARGRISPQDLGIWKDEHVEMLARIVDFLHQHGAVSGIQLAHAGRKASCHRPWDGAGAVPESEGGWQPVGPSAIPFAGNYPMPAELTEEGIHNVIAAFGLATLRAREAGFQVIEIHAAHGYLLHEFLSPLSNARTDKWGGPLEHRTRLAREVIREVRRHWPEERPLLMRLSVTDWTEGGWTPEESVHLARQARELGVDLVDCSSGGNVAQAQIPVGHGYQTGFAERIRREARIMTGAVGMITSAAQADHIIRTGQAEVVFLAREMLRDPYWPLHAARKLRQEIGWPKQYERAR